MRKVVLDTETTGLDPKLGHRIIEVAAIELDGRKVSGRTFHRYINPEREIDEGAAAVHGLTLDRLQDEPKFSEIAPATEKMPNNPAVWHHWGKQCARPPCPCPEAR